MAILPSGRALATAALPLAFPRGGMRRAAHHALAGGLLVPHLHAALRGPRAPHPAPALGHRHSGPCAPGSPRPAPSTRPAAPRLRATPFPHACACGPPRVPAQRERVLEQLGPPPPTQASLALHAHYMALQAVARRSHVIDHVNALLDSCAMLAVKVRWIDGQASGVAGRKGARARQAEGAAAAAATLCHACHPAPPPPLPLLLPCRSSSWCC